ncbi:MAG: ethylbenzene dehydrogenase-related protein [Dehalococcoidia bacterium]|nr:ethylbenzene dehydrogenase-related protein [Dehalococcoidia bacterium]
MNQRWSRALAAVLSLAVLAVLATAGIVAAADPGTVTSVKVDKAPALDGQVEATWNNAPATTVDVAGGVNLQNGATKVNLRSVYTSDSVFFLAEWADPTRSERRSPWVKQADGSWKKLSDPNDKGGDNNLYYEDKMALIWNVNNSIKGFNEQGCAVLCHAGEPGKPYGNKYTASPGEIGDIWHWKSIRTGTVGQIDDQYVDDTRYEKDKAPEAGRKSDAKTAGGYADIALKDGKPEFAAPGQKPAPPYWLPDKDKVALDDSKFKANDEVASILVAPFQGDRGDISASTNTWKDGKWTLEWGRKLDTGSKTDVQYTDLSKTYSFGIAVFDNAQVRHAFSGVQKLAFQTASAPPAATAQAAQPAQLPKTGGDSALPLLQLAIAAAASAGLGSIIRRVTHR